MKQTLRCGLKVKINSFDAIITAVCIRFENITYELSYFYNGEAKSTWHTEHEFTYDFNSERLTIGYK